VRYINWYQSVGYPPGIASNLKHSQTLSHNSPSTTSPFLPLHAPYRAQDRIPARSPGASRHDRATAPAHLFSSYRLARPCSLLPVPKHNTSDPSTTMSSSLTPEQVAGTVLKEKAELEAKVKYLQTQLGQLLEEKRRSSRNSRNPKEQGPRIDLEKEESYPHESSSEEGERGRPFRSSEGGNLDFMVDIPEFKGHLDPDLFLRLASDS